MRPAMSVVGLVLDLATAAGAALYLGSGTAGVLAGMGMGTPGTVTITSCKAGGHGCRGDFVTDGGSVRRDVPVAQRLGPPNTHRRARMLKGSIWVNAISPAN